MLLYSFILSEIMLVKCIFKYHVLKLFLSLSGKLENFVFSFIITVRHYMYDFIEIYFIYLADKYCIEFKSLQACNVEKVSVLILTNIKIRIKKIKNSLNKNLLSKTIYHNFFSFCISHLNS